MRDEKRIKRILELIERIWKTNPDLRFGQFLINYGIAKDDLMTWKMEDDELEEGLKKLIKNELSKI
ncbi:MAG: hypothetical protein AABX11_01355 [Nanoarchaeota archaeon]